MRFPKPWQRKGRGWFVTFNGQQIKLGKKRKEAFERYQQLIAQPQKRVVASDSLLAIIDTFLEWCQKHRAPDTYSWYRDRLERFAQTYPDLRVVDLRPFHIQEWIDGMEVANGTKRNYGRAVKRCVRWAKQQGYVDNNPIADLQLPGGGKRELVVSEVEWANILELVPDRCLRDLLVTTWEIGCRPQESLIVEARHVDLRNQRWVFPESESKTDIPRVVYLTDDVLAITKRLMLQYPTGPLFRNSSGKAWTTGAVNNAFTRIQIRLGRRVLEDSAKNTCKDRRRKYLDVDDDAVAEFIKTLSPLKQSGKAKTEAELRNEARRKLTYAEATRLGTKFSLYAIRHTWMNRLLTRGVDALTVAFLAGHSDPSTLAKVYAHLSQNPSYLLEPAKTAAG